MTERRATFLPVAATGVISAVAAAYAGSKPWAESPAPSPHTITTPVITDAPQVTAVALVLLAAWGLLLFTGGRLRGIAAWVAALAGAGLIASVLHARLTLEATTWTHWFLVAAVTSATACAAAVMAALWARQWPEMGRKYDNPSGAVGPPDEDQSNLDIWKALDEGRDPTS